MKKTFISELQSLGLTQEQAAIYRFLLEKGFSPVQKISLQTNIKRGMTYKALEQLLEKELIQKTLRKGGVALFSPLHPRALDEVLREHALEIQNKQKTLEIIQRSLISEFNLLAGKPNVQFFEGDEAIEKITNDYPISDTEIRQWIDIGEVLVHIKDASMDYLKERIKKNISKRMIIPHNKKSLAYAKKGSKITTFGVMKDIPQLKSAIQVYDDTISILTLTDNKQIGLLIEDRDIAQTLKTIFDQAWSHTEKIT